jgi:hypothetical protein
MNFGVTEAAAPRLSVTWTVKNRYPLDPTKVPVRERPTPDSEVPAGSWPDVIA